MINHREGKRGKESGTGDREPRTEWSLVSTTTEKGVMRLGGPPLGRKTGTWGLEDLCQMEGTWVITRGLVTGQEPVCRICVKTGG